MSYKYEWTKKDMKKVLKEKRKLSNIIFLIIGICLYFYITYYGFIYNEFDNFKLIIGFLVYILVLIGFLYLTTAIYVYLKLRKNNKLASYGTYEIKLTEDDITSSINDKKIVYKWNNIVKFKKRRNCFFIRTKEDKIGLTFRKDILKDDYLKILNFVSKKLKKSI